MLMSVSPPSIAKRARTFFTPVNESKWAMGTAVLLLNVLARSPKISLTDGERGTLDRVLGEEVFVFTVAFTTTRDVLVSLLLTVVFYGVMRVARGGSKSAKPTTQGNVSNEQIGNALDVLEAAYGERQTHYYGGRPWQVV
jgi:hypothetical protein